MSIEFSDCLKRERDISIKAMSSGGKMAFRLTPPLTLARQGQMLRNSTKLLRSIVQKYERAR